jgi:hypothetical protein
VPPRGFDSTRDDATTTAAAKGGAGPAPIDPLAMMVGKVEHTFETDADEVSPLLATQIDRAQGRVTSATGELVTDWRRGLFTLNTPRAQGTAGFLRAAGRIDLADVTFAAENRFGALLAIALDDRPLARSERILLQVGAVDRLAGFTTEPVKLAWQGGEYTGHRVQATGRLPWQIERIQATVTLKGAAGRVRAATVLDPNLRPRERREGRAVGADWELPLPPDAIYVHVELAGGG